MADLIGPLTAEEWCSLRLGADDDPLLCCAETSELRSAIFETLRQGGGWLYGQLAIAPAWELVAEKHDTTGLLEHPVLRKLYATYVKEPGDDRPAG